MGEKFTLICGLVAMISLHTTFDFARRRYPPGLERDYAPRNRKIAAQSFLIAAASALAALVNQWQLGEYPFVA